MPCGEPDARERARPVRRAEAGKRPRASEAPRLASDPTDDEAVGLDGVQVGFDEERVVSDAGAIRALPAAT